ncbi:MAG: CHAT domain-containing protein [Austwickia sp.]|nr:CHAT domain-containing protein [Austwickia sp.]
MQQDALDRALRALDLVQRDAAAAITLARSVIHAPDATGAVDAVDVRAACVAHRALGLAVASTEGMPAAREHLEEAVRLAERVADANLLAETRASLAGVIVQQGQASRALTVIDAAVRDCEGVVHGRVRSQRAAITQHLGRYDAALEDYRAAIPLLRAAGDQLWTQRALMNRSLILMARHSYHQAARDLQEAEEICTREGLAMAGAYVHETLLTLHRRLGNVPAALHHLGQAQRLCAAVGSTDGSLLFERAELLLSMNLLTDAREAAEASVQEQERMHRWLYASEARLLLARACERDAPEVALMHARLAAGEFGRQERGDWEVLARYAVAAVELRLGRPVTPATLVALADELAAAGWDLPAADARLNAARVALTENDHDQALELLRPVARLRRAGPVAGRVRGWVAQSLAAQAQGRRGPAVAAAAAGLRVIEEHRATIAATDLRVRVSGLGVELAAVGLRGAVASGSGWRVLTWSDRVRARHLAVRPVTADLTSEAGPLLAQLRAVMEDIRERRGRGDPVEGLLRRQVHLERRIREVAWLRPDGDRERLGTPDRQALIEALGEAALVEFVEVDDVMYAVCVVGGRARLVRLAQASEVADLVRWVPFALQRLARADTGMARQAGAAGLLRETTASLDRLLLGPLARMIADRRLIVVPGGRLAGVPWAMLTSLRGRAVTVSPSTSAWYAAGQLPDLPGSVFVAAGPRLAAADAEAERVGALHGVAPVTGTAASVAAVLEGLGSSQLAHIAAHGVVRADNAYFSNLTFADGPLTLFELDRLEHCPETVTISACHGAGGVVFEGDEILGFADVLLSNRTRAIVASVGPVPDLEAQDVMVRLHARLAAGEPAAIALAAVQAAAEPASASQSTFSEGDVRSWVAASSFVCLGAGFPAEGRPCGSS